MLKIFISYIFQEELFLHNTSIYRNRLIIFKERF